MVTVGEEVDEVIAVMGQPEDYVADEELLKTLKNRSEAVGSGTQTTVP
ncbi:MAG: hypothetical protein R2773_03005 [Flavobacteriaceae bacterium]